MLERCCFGIMAIALAWAGHGCAAEVGSSSQSEGGAAGSPAEPGEAGNPMQVASGGSSDGGEGNESGGGTAGTPDTPSDGGESLSYGGASGGGSQTATGGHTTSGGQTSPGGATNAGQICELDLLDRFGPEYEPAELPCGRLGDLGAGAGTLLDLGHGAGVLYLQQRGDRLVSADQSGDWVLWNLADHTMVARGRTGADDMRAPYSPPKLAGEYLAVLAPENDMFYSPAELELRSSLDGRLIRVLEIPNLVVSSPFDLPEDASYVWASTLNGTSRDVGIWSLEGNLLHTANDGEFIFGMGGLWGARTTLTTPDELWSTGDGYVRKLSISTGTVEKTAVPGSFVALFQDGRHFITRDENQLRVFSTDSLAERAVVPISDTWESAGGYGDFVWTFGIYQFDVYSISDTSTPVQSRDFGFAFQQPTASGNRVALSVGDSGGSNAHLVLANLAGSEPTFEEPPRVRGRSGTFTAGENGRWFVAAKGLIDSAKPEHALSCGGILLTGSRAGILALATSSGHILLFDVASQTKEYLGALEFDAYQLELSRDGAVLAATTASSLNDEGTDESLVVFDTRDRSELKRWPYLHSNDLSEPRFLDFTMSSDGEHFAHHDVQTVGPAPTGEFTTTFTTRVRDLDDNVSLTVTSKLNTLLRLSSSGARAAIATSEGTGGETEIYEGSELVNLLPGSPLAWLDDERVLMAGSDGVRVFRYRGGLDSSIELPPLSGVSVATSTEVYASTPNAVYSVTDGSELWSCSLEPGDWANGTVAGRNVVFVHSSARSKVLVSPF
jgi:hypothetical protein